MEKESFKKRRVSSIILRIVCGFILLALLLTAVNLYTSYSQYSGLVTDIYIKQANDVVEAVGSYVNGDEIERYMTLLNGAKNEQELENVRAEIQASPQYKQLQQEIDLLRAQFNISDIYIAGLGTPTGNFSADRTYIFDSVDPDSKLKAHKPGEKEAFNPDYEPELKELYAEANFPLDGIVTESEEGDGVGAVYSITNSKGDFVGLISCEINASRFRQATGEYIRKTILLSLAVTVFFVVAYVLLERNKLITPVSTLINEAKSFAGRRHPAEELNEIKTGDEIQELAKSLYQMEVDVNDYILNAEDSGREGQADNSGDSHYPTDNGTPETGME